MFQKMYLASSLLKKISSKFAFDRCVQGRTSEFWFRHSFKYKVAIPRLKSSTEWHLNYTSILVTMSAFDKIKVHISREYYFTMDFYQIKDKKYDTGVPSYNTNSQVIQSLALSTSLMYVLDFNKVPSVSWPSAQWWIGFGGTLIFLIIVSKEGETG